MANTENEEKEDGIKIYPEIDTNDTDRLLITSNITLSTPPQSPNPWGYPMDLGSATLLVGYQYIEIVEEELDEVECSIAEGVKHPLDNSWDFWLFKNDKKRNWEQNLIKLTTFATVEDYWCLYHHTKFPSELKMGQDYAVFKSGIRPMWEDKANAKGGRWLINMERTRCDSRCLDRFWLDTVLLTIGENFENNSEICGVVVNVRHKHDKHKLGIWTADSSNKEACLEIGRKVKKTLEINWKICYDLHDSNNSLYTID